MTVEIVDLQASDARRCHATCKAGRATSRRSEVRKKSGFALTIMAIVVTLLLVKTADAQDEEEKSRKNSLEPGAWAIQFQIEDDIGLKPFNGMIISLKRHFSSHSAFRLGFNLDLRYDDSDRDNTTTRADSLIYTNYDNYKSNSESIQLDLMYMNYPNPGAAVNFFWGVGPLVRFSRSNAESESRRSYQDETAFWYREDKARSWRVGALGAAGVEWFATKGISFHAEYRATASYGKGKSESFRLEPDGDTSSITGNSESADFDGVNVILGLSVYF